MDFTSGQYTQLIVALFAGVVLFVMAYVASEKSVLTALLVTLPFQPITSVFGTVNTVLIYMVASVWIVRGRLKHLPMLWLAVLVLFATLLALSQAPRTTFADHAFYFISIVGNFLLFYVVYNFFRQAENDPHTAMVMFTAVGAAVTAYSLAKVFIGFDSVVLFGVQEFTIDQNLEGLRRLVGPFKAAGVNGAFYGLQILLCLFFIVHTKKFLTRLFLLALVLAASGLLVATGSRGSFIVTIFGFLLFLVLFFRHIGAGRILLLTGAGVTVATLGAALVIQFTDFDVLFERFEETEITGFIPDTRQASFDLAFERIPDAMIFGHGPRLRLINEGKRRIPGYKTLYYPHNLYLHLLLTLGIVGLVAYLSWFLALTTRMIRAMRRRLPDKFASGMTRLGALVMIVFLVDEMKIEFLRFHLFDYQNYMFALFGMFLATADKALLPAAATQRAATDASPKSGVGQKVLPA